MKVLQGGIYNFLGKQKTVNAPVKWKSSAKHPVAYLTYITKKEIDILIKKNIYGSLKNGKPNKGPFGIPSLQGSGSGSEGAGTASSGSQAGDAGYSDYSDAGMGTPGPGAGAGSETGNTGSQAGNASYTDYSDAMMGPVGPAAMGQPNIKNLDIEDKKTEQLNIAPQMARLQPAGIAAYNMSLANPTRSTAEKAIGFAASPIGTTIATIADTQMRGVTDPDDYSQLTESVQREASTSTKSGGGNYNEFTGLFANLPTADVPGKTSYSLNLQKKTKENYSNFDPYDYSKNNSLYKLFNKGGIVNILLNNH
jgi:hypothetical protein